MTCAVRDVVIVLDQSPRRALVAGVFQTFAAAFAHHPDRGSFARSRRFGVVRKHGHDLAQCIRSGRAMSSVCVNIGRLDAEGLRLAAELIFIRHELNLSPTLGEEALEPDEGPFAPGTAAGRRGRELGNKRNQRSRALKDTYKVREP